MRGMTLEFVPGGVAERKEKEVLQQEGQRTEAEARPAAPGAPTAGGGAGPGLRSAARALEEGRLCRREHVPECPVT